MDFENFEQYLSNNLKIKDDNEFQEKLDLLLSHDKNKKKLIKKNKEKKKEEDLKNQKKCKDESNEKKIDFILSDENSFEKYEKKIEQMKEDNYNIDNIFLTDFQKGKKYIRNNDDKSLNITDTQNLINNEKNEIDSDLRRMEEDIKKNNPKIYNPRKIKKYKEMKDLKSGLDIKKDNNSENKITKGNLIKKEKKKNINSKNNINKNYNTKKIINNNLINEIKKEIADGGENDEDLIMSLIQCPVKVCHKNKSNIPKKNNEKLINIININNNKSKENIIKNNIKGNNNIKNGSLLDIYKKEKQIQNELQKIILNNPNISKDDLISEEINNNQFYNFNSNSKTLKKAKLILLEDLSQEEKTSIKEIENNINIIKKQISDIDIEKNKYNKMIEEKKNELIKFKSIKDKAEFEYERELINDLRSVINKYKMEIYKEELGLNKEKDDSENNNKDEEIKQLKEEYNDLKNELNTINKNNEKFIADIQKKIMIFKYENEQMKEKIEFYQQNVDLDKKENEISKDEYLSLLNQNIKKNKLFQLNEEDSNIIISKNNYTNNIIKTTSKLNHLKELDFEFPEKYFDEKDENNNIIKHQFNLDGKTIKIFNNNKKEIIFPNNTKKQVFPDGYTVVYFSNGDIKETIPNYKEIYYYKKDDAYQINFNDGNKYIKYLKTGKIYCDGNLIN